MKYFFDTEFHEDGRIIDLISIGIAAEDGRKLYFVSNEFDPKGCNDFVKENVIPKLGDDTPRLNRAEIGKRILSFIGNDKPEFWAWYGAYDWVLLAQLWGRLVDKPDNFPMRFNDLKQLEQMIPPSVRPPRPDNENEHNALSDAIWNRAYFFLLQNTFRSVKFWKDLIV